MAKFATFALFVLLSCTAFAIDKDIVLKAVQADKVSTQDCRKWYSVYYGTYLYVKEFDCEGSRDFGDVADKMRRIRDKIAPAKGAVEFAKAVDFSKYAELEFTPENKTDFAEDLYQVCEALKKQIEASE